MDTLERGKRSSNLLPVWLGLGLLICGLALGSMSGCGGEGGDAGGAAEPEDVALVQPVDESVWLDPETCRECHAAEVDNWLQSHHAIAHRRVIPEVDREAFAMGTVTDQRGDVYHLEVSEDGQSFAIREEGKRSYPVDGVIGEVPIRQYLVPMEGGRYQAHSLTYDPEKKEWFNVFGEEEREEGDWGHWTQQGMNWNSNCAFCHLTDYQKNYDMRTHSYASEWKREGVSCAQCHDGLAEHVAVARAGNYVAPMLVADADRTVAMENCASCHARREELTDSQFGPGERFHDHYRLVLPDMPHAYFVNGQALDENYVYASFRLSKMAHAGVTCMDCHDPHAGTPKVEAVSNTLCLTCHGPGLDGATRIEPLDHSHHAPGSSGNSCVECHMPERVYMQRDPRRDHGFTSPDPLLTIEFGDPNACNQCHEDQTPEWALQHVQEWYGESDRMKRTRARARMLAEAYDGELPTDELLRFHGEEENPYWRATYMRLLSYAAERTDVKAAAEESLKSDEPIERDAALRVMANRADGLPALQASLNDRSRMVRLQAADALLPRFDSAQQAFREWQDFAEANADRPAGALRRAELAAMQNDRGLASQLARQAVGFDKNNPQLHYDAAILLDRIGEVDTAIAYLRRARRMAPEEGVYDFAYGLLLAEKGDLAGAIAALEEAVKKDPSQDRWWYNLAVAQMQAQQMEAARDSLGKALELSPGNPEYRRWFEQLGGAE